MTIMTEDFNGFISYEIEKRKLIYVIGGGDQYAIPPDEDNGEGGVNDENDLPTGGSLNPISTGGPSVSNNPPPTTGGPIP